MAISNPNWYCKLVEVRAVRGLDRYEVGCDCCGFFTYTFNKRWPKEVYLNYLFERYCSCE